MRGALMMVLCLTVAMSADAAENVDRQGEAGAPRWNDASLRVDVLRSDAAWCGPRILYFFARYHGQTETLDEVVSICSTDSEGVTSLADLVRAAAELGLEPTPVECDSRKLLACGGPAIVCVRGTRDGESSAPIHFVGILPDHDGQIVVVDPSVAAAAMPLLPERFEKVYTGNAVLLKGCPRPPLWLAVFTFPWVLIPAAVLAAGVVVAVRRLTRNDPATAPLSDGVTA